MVTLMFRKLCQSFRAWLRPAPPTVAVVRRYIERMSVQEWRSNKDMVASAMKALATPGVREMLDVLRNSASPHNAQLPLEADLNMRAVWQSRTEGYIAALNDFEALAVLSKPQPHLEPTYEPPEPETSE